MVIDAFVKIKPSGGSGDVVIGRGTVINSGCVLYTGNGIRIGRNVLIAANCTLAPTNHEFADPDGRSATQGFQPSRGGIVIGDDVWIGANCVLLDGTTIGSGSVIGAASLLRGTCRRSAWRTARRRWCTAGAVGNGKFTCASVETASAKRFGAHRGVC